MRHMYPLLLIVLVGCSPAVPPPGEYLPAISVALGVAADVAPTPPSPPAPKPNNICQNCGGPPGTLGDGSVAVDCPLCEGGYVTPPSAIELKQPRSGSPAPASASAPPATAPPKPVAGAPTTPPTALPAKTVYRSRVVSQCGPDGVCRPVRVYERVR